MDTQRLEGSAFDRARSAITAAVAAARVEPMTPNRAAAALLNGEPATPGRSSANKIEVVLRLRPLGASDQSSMVTIGPKSVRMVSTASTDPSQAASSGQFNEFQFDGVLSGNASQEDAFRRACVQSGLIKTVMSGSNGVLFAYGASGHGKTYTVTGTQQQPGLLPRLLQHVFNVANGTPASNEPVGLGAAVAAATEGPTKYLMWISYLEIYNEKIFDLLRVPTEDTPSLKLQEDKKGHIFVKDLTEVRVHSMDEARKCIHDAMKNRAVAETQLNHESSRSHTVFTLKLAQVPASASLEDIRKNPDLMRFSKLSVIDLAGSERASKSGIQTNEQFKEAGSINSSLLTLSRCINAMRQNQIAIQKRAMDNGATAAKLKPVPFRDSKLTRLFQELFNGHGKAVMVVNVLPRMDAFDEASQALKFASIAKTVHVGMNVAPTPSATTSKVVAAISAQESARIAPIPFPSLAAVADQPKDKAKAAKPASAEKKKKVDQIDDSATTAKDSDEDSMDVDTNALVEEVIELRQQVLESHRRCTEIEMEVRDEVSRELAMQMAELERELRAGLEQQIRLAEERHFNSWGLLKDQLQEERERIEELETTETELRQQIFNLQAQLSLAQSQLKEKQREIDVLQLEKQQQVQQKHMPLSPIASPAPAKNRKRKAAAAVEKEPEAASLPHKRSKHAETAFAAEPDSYEPASVDDMNENEPPQNTTPKKAAKGKITRGRAKKSAAAEKEVEIAKDVVSPKRTRRTRAAGH